MVNILEWVAKNFSKDTSKMLIWTGVAGWTLSSLAQVCAVLFNSKISREQKAFLVPQEMADAAVNIASFFIITMTAKKLATRLFTSGKFAPQSVRNYLKKNNISTKNLDLELIQDNKNFPIENYKACKNFGTTLATIGAGVVSSNIVTPIIRNSMASRMQRTYLNNKNSGMKI